MSHKFLATVAALALSLTATVAMAVPITGGISFAGDASPAPAGNWGGATGVDFADTGTNARVSSVSGSYAGVPFGSVNGQLATFTDFTFSPNLAPNPVVLWTFDYNGKTYSFTMDTVQIKAQSEFSLELTGSGYLNITGFDSAYGIWRFTGQQAGTPATFSFSSSNEPIGTPEPGSLALLGLGLLGLGAARRRKV
jgi:hypothetical protein